MLRPPLLFQRSALLLSYRGLFTLLHYYIVTLPLNIKRYEIRYHNRLMLPAFLNLLLLVTKYTKY